jgi:hypothetical protein
MNCSSRISCFFIFLYLVFLGNANIYASNLSIETKTSCCAEESEGCCGSCHSEETKNSDDCCHGNGCCGIVETRLPITIFSSKTEIKQKASVHALRIKPSLNSYDSLVFSFLLPENIGSSKIHFFTHSYRCNDRLAKMSIWRC